MPAEPVCFERTAHNTFDIPKGVGLKSNFWLSRSVLTRFSWNLEASGVGLLLKASYEDGSSCCAHLEQSTKRRKAFMKFVSLRTKRAREQDPSPMYDSYEARLVEMLDALTRRNANKLALSVPNRSDCGKNKRQSSFIRPESCTMRLTRTNEKPSRLQI
jgi:hypothetical protein